MPGQLYDHLVRLGLKPDRDFEFAKDTDSLMRVHERGVRKLVSKRYHIRTRKLHVSMIPETNGVVSTALISMASGAKRPGFWYVVLDATGRPVAEYPLTYSKMEMKPDTDQPPSGSEAVTSAVETTGDLARMLVSWLVGYDRVNDDDSAAILEILSVHALSPREVTIEFKTRSIAQRLHDELVCFEDDVTGIKDAAVQAATLRGKIALLLNEDRV